MESNSTKDMRMKNVIINVEVGSIAEELEIEVGDILLTINGEEVKDVFDYRYMCQEEYLEVVIIKPDGEEWELEIEKDEYEELGIVFESGLMDNAKTCTNKCIFCFIDQNPKGMRETIYFKDDDSRLSFLQGNYVTLTNMKEEDLDRIIFYHLSPINISVHTTNLELRKFMLKNKHSDRLFVYLDKIKNAGIEMNFQIVLCKGINDGVELDNTIEKLAEYMPNASSVSVVPIGLSKYREGLHEMQPFTKEDASNVIKQVTDWQKKLTEKYGKAFVYISDEFYLKAEEEFPSYESYDDFPQLENGVGSIRLFESEVKEALEQKYSPKDKKIAIVTGVASYEFIKDMASLITDKYKNVEITVIKVVNDFFGESITVTGLLVGRDIVRAINSCEEQFDNVMIPVCCLRDDDIVFLDDMTVDEIEEQTNKNVIVSEATGYTFVETVLG